MKQTQTLKHLTQPLTVKNSFLSAHLPFGARTKNLQALNDTQRQRTAIND